MRVTVNGEIREVDDGTTVADLVAGFGLQPKFVAVEINLELVPRRCFDETTLKEGDRIEIVTLVGGG